MTYNPTTLMRKRLIEKYGKRCFYCNNKLGEYWITEHKTPRSKNGSNKIDNLVPSCERCNISKASYTLLEWYIVLYKKMKFRQAQIKIMKKIIKKLKAVINPDDLPI